MDPNPVKRFKALLSADLIQKALLVVQSSKQCAIKGYKYTIIQEDLYEKAGDFMAVHLFPDEPLCKGIDLTWNPEMKDIMMSVLKQNMSLCLISTETGEIIGLRIIQVEEKDQHFETDDLKEESVKLFMNIVEFVENTIDVFEHYGVEEVFDFFGLSVHIDHRRKGLGQKFMQAANIFIENLYVGPVVVKGFCDSVFSNRIYEKTGYTLLKKLSYEDLMKDKNIFIRCSEQHKYITRIMDPKPVKRFKSLLSTDLVQKALQVVQSSAQCAVEGYRYTIIQEDLYEKAGDFMAVHLFPDEPLCKGIDLTWNLEIEDIMMSALKENISLALISKETDEIVGLRIIQVEEKDQHIETDDLKEESVKLFMNIVGLMENTFDVFEHYEVEEVFSFFGLSVHIDHRRKGLGLKLMHAAIIFIENLKVGPVVVKGDCDSVFSNRIYEKTDYTLLKKVSYEDFMKENNIFIRCPEQHRYITRFAKII